LPLIAALFITASAVLFLFISAVTRPRGPGIGRFVVEVCILCVYILFLVGLFGIPRREIIWRGQQDASFLTSIIELYCFMLAGMVAEHLYRYLGGQHQESRQSGWAPLAQAALASPMVFIPLVASLRENSSSLTKMDAATVMTFLVAFENGFLWKAYFAARLASEVKASKSKNASAKTVPVSPPGSR
jgi:hypothetical protein